MQVNMLDAKNRLSRLVQAVLDGEEVILARNGEPVARITRYLPAKAARKPGAFRGLIRMAPDWDSAETNREIAAQLEAAPIEPQAVRAPKARQLRARYRVARRRTRSRAR
jgi:prevent-host-death family protein